MVVVEVEVDMSIADEVNLNRPRCINCEICFQYGPDLRNGARLGCLIKSCDDQRSVGVEVGVRVALGPGVGVALSWGQTCCL